ncbi:hypothetical protein BDF14DRAFT_1303429 [Spinellus fusiger]|nr:hypothetical protein BDF14DRAFT_1303429 [Spinellus fusiger]
MKNWHLLKVVPVLTISVFVNICFWYLIPIRFHFTILHMPSNKPLLQIETLSSKKIEKIIRVYWSNKNKKGLNSLKKTWNKVLLFLMLKLRI